MVVGMEQFTTDVLVIGGGPGGYVAAIRAAELGLSTVLVERDERLGGICLHRGCMPSKALLSVADLAYRARTSAAIGLKIPEVRVDLAAVGAWQRETVDRLAKGVAGLLERHGVSVVRGDGILADRNRVAVAASHGSDLYTVRRGIILATGATPIMAGGLKPDGKRVVAASDALFIDLLGTYLAAAGKVSEATDQATYLDQLPSRIAVVGADYVAIELATALAKLGCTVTLVGADLPFLPEVDGSLGPVVLRGLRKLGITWRASAMPLGMEDQGLRIRELEQESILEIDLVIVSSSGRSANVDDLGLDLMPIRRDAAGALLVDERQRTSLESVYAVGDMTPGLPFADRAIQQGKVAAEVLAGRPAAYDPRALPAVVLSDPELASVGLGEAAARAQGYDAIAASFPWQASGRALTLGARDGATTVVADRATGLVLGVHIAGAQAGELSGEAALALEMGATLEDLAATMHPHPRLNEGLAEAAELALGLPTHALPQRAGSTS
jgi:dihydrolipoamide dehydrogenase